MNAISKQLSSAEREVIVKALTAYSWAVAGAYRDLFIESIIEKVSA